MEEEKEVKRIVFDWAKSHGYSIILTEDEKGWNFNLRKRGTGQAIKTTYIEKEAFYPFTKKSLQKEVYSIFYSQEKTDKYIEERLQEIIKKLEN